MLEPRILDHGNPVLLYSEHKGFNSLTGERHWTDASIGLGLSNVQSRNEFKKLGFVINKESRKILKLMWN